MTGAQAGIFTGFKFRDARIKNVDTENIRKLLHQGIVPVICGFQGVETEGWMTTLGRGGSDTTAAALGAALEAERVEIYTDVEGIMTADPRVVANATILVCVSLRSSASCLRGCEGIHAGRSNCHGKGRPIFIK
jgi:aspartate kinase